MKKYGIRFLFSAALMLLVAQGLAFAQLNNDQVLNVHVSREVAIPGNVLTPGDYTFRLLDKSTGPMLMEVAKADGSRAYGFVVLLPADRRTAGGTEIDVRHPAGEDIGLISRFFFPGESTGYAIDYSRGQIRQVEGMASTGAAKINPGS